MTRWDGLLFEWMPLCFLPLVFGLLVLCRLRPSRGAAWAASGAALAMGLAAAVVMARAFWSDRAPFEEPADPAGFFSEQPWYLLGLGEKLSYWDPWWKGVILPLLPLLGPGLAVLIAVIAPRKPRKGTVGEGALPAVLFDVVTVALGLLVLGAVLVLIFGPGSSWPFEFYPGR